MGTYPCHKRQPAHDTKSSVTESLFRETTTKPSAVFSDIEELTIKQLHIGGRTIEKYSSSGIPEKLENVTHFKSDFKDK